MATCLAIFVSGLHEGGLYGNEDEGSYENEGDERDGAMSGEEKMVTELLLFAQRHSHHFAHQAGAGPLVLQPKDTAFREQWRFDVPVLNKVTTAPSERFRYSLEECESQNP